MDFVVAPTHPCLPGHFPGRAVVPGVLILDHVLDAIERAHGPLVLRSFDRLRMSGAQDERCLLRLPQVKFLQPLLPGETATIALEQTPASAGAAPRWRFRVTRGETLLASGEVVLADGGAKA